MANKNEALDLVELHLAGVVMPGLIGDVIPFKRNRFSARFPTGYLYSLSHFWLSEDSPGCWRIGLTNFATRMLGEIVEFDFEVNVGEQVEVASRLGWIEGFKAVSDLYCVAEGKYQGLNSDAVNDTSIICADPYKKGWLYRIKGTPDSGSVDVNGYIEHLEVTIDKMLEKPWKSPELTER
jgi:glycine cleavage system H protein